MPTVVFFYSKSTECLAVYLHSNPSFFLHPTLTLLSTPPSPGSIPPPPSPVYTYSINRNLCSTSYISLLLQRQPPIPHFQSGSLSFVYPGHAQFKHDHILKVFQPFSSIQFLWWQQVLYYSILAVVRPASLNVCCFSLKAMCVKE